MTRICHLTRRLALAGLLGLAATPALAVDPAKLAGAWIFTVDNGQGGFPINVTIAEGFDSISVGRIGRSHGDGITGARLRGDTLTIDTRMAGWCGRGSAATLTVDFRDNGRFRRGMWSGTCKGQDFGTLPVVAGQRRR